MTSIFQESILKGNPDITYPIAPLKLLLWLVDFFNKIFNTANNSERNKLNGVHATFRDPAFELLLGKF